MSAVFARHAEASLWGRALKLKRIYPPYSNLSHTKAAVFLRSEGNDGTVEFVWLGVNRVSF